MCRVNFQPSPVLLGGGAGRLDVVGGNAGQFRLVGDDSAKALVASSRFSENFA
jgi:hypothetical protein